MVVGELIQEKELIVIGGGPGGYTAAIRAAQLGLKVTLIEKGELGGVCLNKGCIPSKVYTHAAREMDNFPHLQDLGMESAKPALQLQKLIDYKNRITDQLKKGVAALCKANKIEVIHGEATFLSNDRIGVESGHDFQTFRFEKAILATGGKPTAPEGISAGDRIFISYDIFSLEEIPEKLIIQGGDIIALEMATTFQAFGSQVTVLLEENEDFPFDAAVTKELRRIFKKKKIALLADCQNIRALSSNEGVTVSFLDKKGEETSLEGSHFYTTGSISIDAAGLGIDRLGMEMTPEGRVKIDANMLTSIPSVYAIGDMTPGPLLAVKAIKQGKAIASILSGQTSEVDLTLLPAIAHTLPPISTAGLTEAEAKEFGYSIKTSQFPLASNGFASILGSKDGFVKIVAEEDTGLVLGVHMIGTGAVELSGMMTIGLEMVARDEDFTFPHYAHPSINESILEAVEGLVGQAIHMAPKK